MNPKFLPLLFLFFFLQTFGQELKVVNSASVSIDELPEYVIVTSENTKLIGGIDITIDYKRSQYQDRLEELESLLQNRKKLHIRNQTDLLNAMSKLGFEYVDSYTGASESFGLEGGDDVKVFGSDSKFRTNMVFRKKEIYRN
jgi:hypothetical protein